MASKWPKVLPPLTQEQQRISDDFMKHWLEVEKDHAAFARFLDEHILGVADFTAYIERCGGLHRMQELRQREFLLHMGK